MWVRGTTEGKSYRQSLKTRSWERAEELKKEIERGNNDKITIKDAFKKFLEDCQARGLKPPTLAKYGRLETRLNSFADQNRLARCRDFTADTVRSFRSTRRISATTAGKELGILRSFRFCEQNEWIAKNPTAHIKAASSDLKPTMPFNVAEQAKIRLAAQKVARGGTKGRRKGVRPVWPDSRLPIFVDLMLETGLRISDAAMLTVDRIHDGRLFLYTAKTGHPVHMPLRPATLAALKTITPEGGYYYFINSDSLKVSTVAEYWRVKLASVFKEAGIKKGHPHRLRDSAAMNWLVAGIDIKTVSMLLGHSSVKITEKQPVGGDAAGEIRTGFDAYVGTSPAGTREVKT